VLDQIPIAKQPCRLTAAEASHLLLKEQRILLREAAIEGAIDDAVKAEEIFFDLCY
jgi:hypothetical protein